MVKVLYIFAGKGMYVTLDNFKEIKMAEQTKEGS